MVEYQRPEFYVEEFVANEYVAACNVAGEIMGTDCGEYKFTGILEDDNGVDTISSVMVNNEGAWTGAMYKVTGGSRAGSWAYTGTIYDSNHKVGNSMVSEGKYTNGSSPIPNVTQCDCEFKVTAQHHHVEIKIVTANNS